MGIVRVDLHQAYDGCAFIFAPEQNILQQIKDHLEKIEANILKDPNYYGREGNLKSYKEVKHSQTR